MAMPKSTLTVSIPTAQITAMQAAATERGCTVDQLVREAFRWIQHGYQDLDDQQAD